MKEILVNKYAGGRVWGEEMVKLLFTHEFMTFLTVIDNNVTIELTRRSCENFNCPQQELQLGVIDLL